MAQDHSHCPECGASNAPELARCDACHATLHDVVPWRSDHVAISLPRACLIWGAFIMGTATDGAWHDAFNSANERYIAIAIVFVALTIGGLLQKTGGMPSFLRAVSFAAIVSLLLSCSMQLARFTSIGSVISDPISQTILLFGVYGILVLLTKLRVTANQELAARHVRRLCAELDDRTDDFLPAVRNLLRAQGLGPHNQLIAYNRLHWIYELRSAGRTDAEIADALANSADSDWEAISSSFMTTQFLVWLLPTTGFVGTVWGMTNALGSFSNIGTDLGFRANLEHTTQSLGVAFHTTLIGLLAVIPVLALATIAQRRARNLLRGLDGFCLRIVMGRLPVAPVAPEPAPIVEPEPEPELPAVIVDEAEDLHVIETPLWDEEEEVEELDAPVTAETFADSAKPADFPMPVDPEERGAAPVPASMEGTCTETPPTDSTPEEADSPSKED